MSEEPSSPVGNGRDAKGRFAPGNRAAKGNPLNAKAQRLRAACLRAVSVADVKAVVGALVTLARAGDVAAATLLLRYTVGRPPDFDPAGDGGEPREVVVTIARDDKWYDLPPARSVAWSPGDAKPGGNGNGHRGNEQEAP